jgi:hypothetical protein
MKKIQNMEVPTTVTELRDDLLTMYAEIGHGHIKLPLAKEKANTAGKIIKSAAIQLEYAIAAKRVPKIAFLDAGDEE